MEKVDAIRDPVLEEASVVQGAIDQKSFVAERRS